MKRDNIILLIIPFLLVMMIAVFLIPDPEGSRARFILIPETVDFEDVDSDPLEELMPDNDHVQPPVDDDPEGLPPGEDIPPVEDTPPDSRILIIDKPGFSPKHFSPRCIDTYDQLMGIIEQVSDEYDVPPELIAAIITSESSWDDNSYRYEPLFQTSFIDGNPYWVGTDFWVDDGPTIRDWFSWNPDRRGEMDQLTQSQLDTVAQTRLSASYGLMQVLYTSSVPYCDFDSPPEVLYDITNNVQCGTHALDGILDKYDNDLVDSVSAYNAGEPSWMTNEHNRLYTEKVIGLYHAYLECPN